MGSSHSKNTMTEVDECAICLEKADPRGGVGIYSPGCCGKWYHQGCIDDMLRTGNNFCPNCRVIFPGATFLPAALHPINFTATQQPPNITITSVVPPVVPTSSITPSIYTPQVQFLSHPLEDVKRNSSVVCNNSEDPLDKSEVKTSDDLAKSNHILVSPFITLSCIPEKNELSLLQSDHFFVNINLKASSSTTENPRIPMDIVCVLDNSGSMQGTKLNSVKLAMQFVTRQLTSADRLSIIEFNSSAKVTHGLYAMNEARKSQSGNLVQNIKAGGGTDIYSGMVNAVNILDQRTEVNKLSCIFLLTDGEDSSHMAEKLELSKRIRSSGYSLFVFGFGKDHDSRQLESIANAAEASFVYVEQDSMIVDAFGGTLGSQRSVFAKDLKITINMDPTPRGENNSKIESRQTFAGQYLCTINPEKTSVEVFFANLFQGEVRDVLIRLKVPAVAEEILRYPLLTAYASYKDNEGNNKYALAVPQELYDTIDTIIASPPDSTAATTATCHISRSSAPNPKENLQVDAQKNRMLLTTAISNATKKADHGDFEAAKIALLRTIDSVKNSSSISNGNEVSNAVLQELNNSYGLLSNPAQYSALGGKAELRSQTNRWNQQRSTYTSTCRSDDNFPKSKSSNIFQNEMSITAQEIGSRFKSSKK